MTILTWAHSGDFGDTIAACALIRDLTPPGCQSELVLFPTNTRERMSPRRASIIAPLLERQHYISRVCYADDPEIWRRGVFNADHWRHHYRSGLNLADMYHNFLGKPHLDRDQPWLWCYEPNPVAEVVFARSSRYHGAFPWKKTVKKYEGRSFFLGMPEEHAEFVRQFGDVPYYPTANLLEAANVIAAAKMVCVNQASLFWVTESLKRPVCLEAAHGSTGLRNCHYVRTSYIYIESEHDCLPDAEDLDERLALVCAERDLDRSIVDVERRRNLARLALSCAGLDGCRPRRSPVCLRPPGCGFIPDHQRRP